MKIITCSDANGNGYEIAAQELRVLLSYAKDNSYNAKEQFFKEERKILEKYMKKPLVEIDSEKKYTVEEAVKYAFEVFDKRYALYC